MLKENTKVKMGVYTSGVHVKIIAELDLIIQDHGFKDKAIYLFETSFVRDPKEPITDDIIQNYTKIVLNNFKEQRYSYKTKDRKQADLFLKKHLGKLWKVEREFKEL